MPVISNSKALDVYSGTNTTMTFGTRSFYKRNGTDLQIYDYTGQAKQRWEFEPTTPEIGQEFNLWCWNASALMSALTYTRSDITQRQICQEVKGSIINDTGTLIETVEAANFASGFSDYIIDDVLSENNLKTLLDNGNPVILSRGVYDSSGRRTGGHATVVFGYYMDGSTARFLIRDPWPIISNPWPDSPAGQTYELDYATICDGSATGFDNSIWDSSIYR